MRFVKLESRYIIKLRKGENIVENLIKFSEVNDIKNAYFNGIGAVLEATLSFYDLKKKKYEDLVLEGEWEITSLIGNIMQMDNKAVVHAHIALSDKQKNLKGGHLKEAVTGGTCEIVLDKLNSNINRKYDEETGLNLMDMSKTTNH